MIIEKFKAKKFEFGKNLEFQIAGTLLGDLNLFASIFNYLIPDVFDNRTVQVVVSVMKNHFIKYSHLPTIDIIRAEAKNYLTPKDDLDLFHAELLTISESNITEKDYIRDAITENYKHNKLKLALFEGAEMCIQDDPDQNYREKVYGKILEAYEDPHAPTSLRNHLTKKFEFEKNRKSELLGYRLNKFSRLCKRIDGLQRGFYVVGAETNVGKTVFVINLALDALESNDNLHVIYISLDDSKDVIINRMIATLKQLPINDVQKYGVIEDSLTKSRIEDGYEKLKKYADERLSLEDISTIYKMEILEHYIRQKVRKHKDVLVIVDALYNIVVDNASGNVRTDNIERATRLKNLVDTHNIPCVCTAELRKDIKGEPTLNDLMETGKFGYNANLILLLWPEDKEDVVNKEPFIAVNCRYAKNKLSDFKGSDKFVFYPRLAVMEEAEQNGMGNFKVNPFPKKSKSEMESDIDDEIAEVKSRQSEDGAKPLEI